MDAYSFFAGDFMCLIREFPIEVLSRRKIQKQKRMPDSNHLTDEGLSTYVGQIVSFYVKPEIDRRKSIHGITDDYALYAFQIVINMHGPTEVRLNEEIKGLFNVDSLGDISAQELFQRRTEVKNITKFKLLKEDADSAHVTFANISNDLQFFRFDYRYNTLKRLRAFNTSKEFLTTAEGALYASNFRAFHENLFTAMECAISALLMFLPDSAYLNTKTHDAWKTRINLWAHNGNVDHAFVDLFNTLHKNRQTARYGEFKMIESEARSMFETAKLFYIFVERSIPEVA